MMRTPANSLSFDSVPGMHRANERALVLPFEALGETARGAVAVRGGPRLRIMSASLEGVAQAAPKEARAVTPSEHLFFGMTVEGCSVASQRGRETAIADGDAVLLARGEEGFCLAHADAVRFVGLRFERDELAALVPDLGDVIAARVPRDDAALVLLSSYLRAVEAGGLLELDDGRVVVERHVFDLLALALGARRDVRALAKRRSVRAAHLRVIERDVIARLGDASLSPSTIATRHRVSTRWIHKLFEERGVSFSAFVLEQRLLRARRMLEAPRFDARTIAAIAAEVGFGDLSYFNRTFRRRFGATPSEIRRGR